MQFTQGSKTQLGSYHIQPSLPLAGGSQERKEYTFSIQPSQQTNLQHRGCI